MIIITVAFTQLTTFSFSLLIFCPVFFLPSLVAQAAALGAEPLELGTPCVLPSV